MCGLALAVVAGAARHGGPAIASLWAGTRWPKVLLIVASLAAYATVLDVLGFLACDGTAHARAPARHRSGALADGAADRRPFDARRLVGAEAPALIQLPAGIFEIG